MENGTYKIDHPVEVTLTAKDGTSRTEVDTLEVHLLVHDGFVAILRIYSPLDDTEVVLPSGIYSEMLSLIKKEMASV